MSKIIAINGSYRNDGVTDKVVLKMVQSLVSSGAEVEVILLREYPIEFCLNCRECTQQVGDSPSNCVLHDGMADLIKKIEGADSYIFASPTNYGSVTALYKRFLERLIVYAYWPWGMYAPKYRKANVARKKAVVISSCAAPGIVGRLIYGTHKQLKVTAKTVGADTVGTLFTGKIAQVAHRESPESLYKKIDNLASKLL